MFEGRTAIGTITYTSRGVPEEDWREQAKRKVLLRDSWEDDEGEMLKEERARSF